MLLHDLPLSEIGWARQVWSPRWAWSCWNPGEWPLLCIFSEGPTETPANPTDVDLLFSSRELAESPEPPDSPASRDTEWVWGDLFSWRNTARCCGRPRDADWFCVQGFSGLDGAKGDSGPAGPKVEEHNTLHQSVPPTPTQTSVQHSNLSVFPGRAWYLRRERRPRIHGMFQCLQLVTSKQQYLKAPELRVVFLGAGRVLVVFLVREAAPELLAPL